MRHFNPLANIAIATGDGKPPTEKDFEDWRRHEANEVEGLCPNGCGPITYLDDHNRTCTVCGFHGWTNVPRAKD